MTLALPTACILLSATAFLVVERVAPGRALPEVGGWYTRALLTALAQAGIAIATNSLWDHLFSRASMLSLADWHEFFTSCTTRRRASKPSRRSTNIRSRLPPTA
jgi:hypothetical protein